MGKQIKYESFENKKMVWLILERLHDPEVSIFKLIRKIEKRNNRTHESIEMRIKKLILIKLQSELTYEEFKDLFIIVFCKMVRRDTD